jgi:HK97 family phage portal protein
MGFIDFLLGTPETKPDLTARAGIAIPFYQDAYFTPFNTFRVDRSSAMQVPAVSRARNIIAGTIATLGLKSYNDLTGETILGRSILKQPDPALPFAVTMAWTVEDVLFHGRAFWQVLEVSLEDGRPTQARRIDPTRVTFTTDLNTQEIVNGFYIEGGLLPVSGIGSLIMFSGLDEGILNRGGRTISTALKLEEAVQRMATEPNPTMVIKNTGVDLPPDQVLSLLANWKQARATRSTAYLSGPLDVTTFGYDAGQMQLAESRLNTASEIARMCNIPAWYINAESASATYSNVSQERRSLVDFSLKPFMSVIAERLSMDDITPPGQVVRFDVDDYLRGNPLEQIEVLTKMLDAGIINLDEARGQMDLAPRGNSLDESSDSTKREMNIAEVVQKVYLGVDKVITSDEARKIVNQAGGSLSVPGPDFAPKGNPNNAT